MRSRAALTSSLLIARGYHSAPGIARRAAYDGGAGAAYTCGSPRGGRMATVQEDLVAGLEGFSGRLLGPDDDGYNEARRIHNGLIDKRPALIARCLGTADVAAAVDLARERGLEVSVRGGGHNVAGKAVTDGGVMIDLAPMK